MRRGYAVFRALSPACVCDLAIIQDGMLTRVEVTTGSITPRGARSHPKRHATDNYDLLAVVYHDGRIDYTPALGESAS